MKTQIKLIERELKKTFGKNFIIATTIERKSGSKKLIPIYLKNNLAWDFGEVNKQIDSFCEKLDKYFSIAKYLSCFKGLKDYKLPVKWGSCIEGGPGYNHVVTYPEEFAEGKISNHLSLPLIYLKKGEIKIYISFYLNETSFEKRFYHRDKIDFIKDGGVSPHTIWFNWSRDDHEKDGFESRKKLGEFNKMIKKFAKQEKIRFIQKSQFSRDGEIVKIY